MPSSHRFSWIPWFLVFAILVGAGGWFYLRRSKGSDRANYLTAPVTRGDLAQVVTATGTLNPVLNVQVGSQISGIIQKLFVDFNSQVTQGQVVAQIDPGTYNAIVKQADGELASSIAGLELAQTTERRTRRLAALNNSTQAEVDAAVASLHQAEAQVKIKEGALARARIDLERCTIYAPINGSVISRSVDVGQTVAASLSAPVLFTIANDLTKMQIDANVAEADVGAVEVGQKVDFSVDAFPYRVFHGVVTQVRNAPLTVQNVVTYDTVIGVENADLKLKPGMTANVSVLIAERKDALKLPNAALRVRIEDETEVAGTGPVPQRRGGVRSLRGPKKVYVLPAGAKAPVAREVKLGITDSVSTEILEGLAEGDTLVTGVLQAKGGAKAPTNPFIGQQQRPPGR